MNIAGEYFRYSSGCQAFYPIPHAKYRTFSLVFTIYWSYERTTFHSSHNSFHKYAVPYIQSFK